MPELDEQVPNWIDSVAPVTATEVMALHRRRQQRANRAMLAATFGFLLVVAAAAVIAQSDGSEENTRAVTSSPTNTVHAEGSTTPPPDMIEIPSHESVRLDDGTEIIVSIPVATIGQLTLQVADGSQRNEESMEFALRLENRGTSTVYLNDTRTSAFLDEAESIVIGDEGCGYEGVCLDVWLAHRIAPQDALDLSMFVALLSPEVLEEEGVYSFSRRIESSPDNFMPGGPTSGQEVDTFDVVVTVRVIPPS